MKALARNLFTGLAVGSMALAGAVYADDNDKLHAKHKVIEIKADTDSDVNIVLTGEGYDETITLSFDELQDEYILEEKLSYLDEDVRKTIMSALQGVKELHVDGLDGNTFIQKAGKKVIVLNKGEGSIATANTYGDMDFDVEFLTDDGSKAIKKHIVIGDGQEVLKGHTDAIVRLIERGEFTQDELDKIQMAIDVKR